MPPPCVLFRRLPKRLRFGLPREGVVVVDAARVVRLRDAESARHGALVARSFCCRRKGTLAPGESIVDGVWMIASGISAPRCVALSALQSSDQRATEHCPLILL